MIKKFLTVILSLLFLVMSCISAFAAGQTGVVQDKNDIAKIETFTTTTTEFNKEFADQITENHKKYDLKGVNYRVLTSKKLERDEPILHKVDYNDLYAKNVKPPETLSITKDGQNLDVQLTSVQYEPTTITGRQETLSAYTDFDYKTVQPEPSGSKTVEYYDNASKQNITATLKLKELREVDPWAWRDDVTIPITFSIYDAEYYVLGDKYIPYNNQRPALQGYEKDLLNELKLDTEKYKITSVEWDGEPYTVGEARYRKAIAKGERYAANYVALYEDLVNLPNVSGYNAVAQYESKVAVLNGETEYTVEATAIYTPNHTTSIIVASVFGGILFIVLLVIAILYIISKKDKKRGET